MITELLLLLAFALVAYYLWQSQGVQEHATAVARQACQKRQLQFLDFSVEKRSTSVVLAEGGQPQWQRLFHFEFTVGEGDRYSGSLTLQGKRLTALQFDPYPIADDE